MKISIAMTTYNGASYLREQLDSICGQTRLPDELIVCDDRSTDETASLLQDYAVHPPFAMKLVINDERLGSTKNFEKAISLCSGDIIALADQDDVWDPRKLETIERKFEDDPGLGLVFSNGDLIDQRGAKLRGDIWSRFLFGPRLRRRLDSSRGASQLLLSRYFITGATMAFRSNFRNVLLPIPEGIPTFIHDRWIAVLVGALARVEAIEEKLIAYRLHAQQQMGVGKDRVFRQHLEPSRCSSDYEALGMMRQRLVDTAGENSDFLGALDARQKHLAVRCALPRRFMPRFKAVFREYLSGNYGCYPLGRADAVKDLLVGTQ